MVSVLLFLNFKPSSANSDYIQGELFHIFSLTETIYNGKFT